MPTGVMLIASSHAYTDLISQSFYNALHEDDSTIRFHLNSTTLYRRDIPGVRIFDGANSGHSMSDVYILRMHQIAVRYGGDTYQEPVANETTKRYRLQSVKGDNGILRSIWLRL